MWTNKLNKEKFEAWLSSRTSRIPTGNKDPYVSSMRSSSRLLSALKGNAASRKGQQETDLVSAQLYDRGKGEPSYLGKRLLHQCDLLLIPDTDEFSIVLLLFLEALKLGNNTYQTIAQFWYNISKNIPLSILSNKVELSYLISYFSVAENDNYCPLQELDENKALPELRTASIEEVNMPGLSKGAQDGAKYLIEAIKGYATRSARKEMFNALDVIFSFDKISTIDRIFPDDETMNKRAKEIVANNMNLFSFSSLLFGSLKTNTTKSVSEKADLFLTALHTKPFLLLAGISGTGKSQKVQELAFMTCPEGKLREEGGTTPGNYCLIEVKPNWHDSTELLGYYSALTGRYELTDFIRFVYKAIRNENVPFFLCLDEMNLAPVEQYFAEFLSVLETRKRVGEHIVSEPLLPKMRFNNCKLQEYIHTEGEGVVVIDGENYNMKDLYQKEDREVMEYLMKNGLGLPDNLFVIGTVNMDDTTHQFSRKVIDRAFTIEMNGGKLSDMFTPESKMLLEYREEPLPLDAFKSVFVRAHEVLDHEKYAKYKEVISKQIPLLLGDSDGSANPDSVNGVLNNTPFRVSYRVQNELVLYLSVLIERAGFPEPDNISGLIAEATLAILLEKVLPRIQGEQKQLETKKGASNVLKDLKTFVEDHLKPAADSENDSVYNEVIRKLTEMNDKLTNYYTNFF